MPRLPRLCALLVLALLFTAPQAASAQAPVAAYSFDEGAGSTLGDATGNGRNGAIVGGASWTAGRYGSALQFDGASGRVDLPALGTFYKTAFTLEAWVRKATTKTDVGIVGTWNYPEGGPMLWSDWVSGRAFLTLATGNVSYLDSTRSPAIGTWQHLTATFGAGTARFYVDGTQVATRAFAGNVGDSNVWRIGAYGSSPFGFFDGAIDEVRIYDRALSAAEVAENMTTRVRNDTEAPTAPTSFTKTSATGTTITTSWTASTDNIAVNGYRVFSGGSLVATVPSGTTYTFTGLSCSTSYTLGVEAFDSSGNTSNRTALTTTSGACDGTAPSVAMSAPAAGASVSGTVAVSATATDNDSVVGVQFKLDGVNLGAEDTTAPYTINWDTSTATPGAHTLSAVARDPSGNSMSSAGRSVTVVGPTPTPPIAAYAFDDASGVIATDSSGNGRNGTISGASWALGRFGGALSFDGINDRVDLPALGTFYKNAFTLEAWVRKATAKNDVGVVGAWDNTGGPMMWIDHIATRYYQTFATGMSSYLDSTRSPAIGTWQHIAATYDGSTARFYVDGALTASRSFTGNVGDANVWRIGAYGATPFGFFDGLIDEVRVYDRALTAGQIAVDMTTAIHDDDTPPSAPTAFAKTGSTSTSITTGWAASTDNVAVVGYRMFRNGTQVGTATGTTYTFTGLTCNTSYTLGVEAVDGAGNASTRTNLTASTNACDTTPPNIALTAPAAGPVSGTVAVNASASDDDSVAGVQFKLDGVDLDAEDTTAPFSIDWNTTSAAPGSHTLTAVARDPSGNTATSPPVTVTVPVPPAGPAPVAAYSFDEGGGSTLGDVTGNGHQGTINGAVSWKPGKFGNALDFNGTSTVAELAGLQTFYKGAFTLEAWVKRESNDTDAGIVGSWDFHRAGGPMLWLDYPNGRTGLAMGTNSANFLNATGGPPVGSWQHVAATYDGSTAKLFVDGTQVASQAFSGNVGDSTVWRIGAYGTTAGDFFDGLIDEVRIYDRALTAGQIGADMNTPLSTRPVVLATTPEADASQTDAGTAITATFNQNMLASSVTTTTFQLRDASNALVPATVSYDAAKGRAQLTPSAALTYGATYTVTIKSGAAGVTSPSGGTLATDKTWSFTVTSRPPVLLVTSTTNRFSSYMSEILKAEGLAAYTTLDVSLLSSTVLNGFEQVVLGEVPVTAAQATMLTNWVTAGGQLVASRPDKDLASLLGLTDLNATLSEAYLKADAATGVTTDTMQFHGAADRYSLTGGATAAATLYTTATVATTSPAVSRRVVGSGQAVAFTFDLAKSVIYTRQGNPAWAGQERDGLGPMRPNDLFFGAKTGDIRPDWVDLNKVAIPQADEAQRLFANVMNSMAAGRTPLPRFWYLPRSLKAAVVMTGDDHALGGTAGRFNQYLAASAPGCSVADWECVRSTSYVYPNSPLTPAQAASYHDQGFEVALHYSPVGTGALDCGNWTAANLMAGYDTQMYTFRKTYPGVEESYTGRTHCVSWSDWASFPKLEAQRGIRLDVNYYYYPGSWMGSKPGFMTGGGFPMRFADTDGTTIDAFQANTVITDESSQAQPTTINALLDNALGTKGYYGAFVANIHTDSANSPDSTAIISSAQAHNVPVIAAEQLADWTDGRDRSSFSGFMRSGGTVSFDLTANAKARGLTAMLPISNGTQTLSSIKLGAVTVPFTTQTIKGVPYAFFSAASGRYTATYS